MNITKKKRGFAMLAAAVTLAAGASLVASPAFAATSSGPVYLVDYDSGAALPTSVNWASASIGLSLNPTGLLTGFSTPAGTSTVQAFLAVTGTEDNVAGWLASLPSDAVNVTNAAPDTLGDNPAVAGDFHSLLTAGGSWSLGVAFVGADNSYKGGYFTTITIAAGSTNMTYTPPAAVAAPVITTQPTSTSVVAGSNATFTAAATSVPAKTVKWQSAPSASSTFTDIAAGPGFSGVTTDTLTVNNVQAAASGTQFKAVYTNSAGSTATSIAVLTVTLAAPTQPVAGDPHGLPHVDVAEGATTVALTGTGIAQGTYGVWAWSTPTQLPNATVDASGNVTLNIAGLTPGVHTIALTSIVDNSIVGWLTITIPAPTNTSNVNLTVSVTTSNKFALEGVASALDLGSAARGGVAEADLPAFTVTDDRNALPGWNLTSAVADFVNDGVAFPANAGDVIDKGALAINARKVGPALTGITAQGAYTASASNLFATGLANSSTPATGTQFDAHLAFTVPSTAKAGKYASTLTLTLTSK